MDSIKNQSKMPYYIRRLYNSSGTKRSKMISVPATITMALKLNDENYVRVWHDKINDIILISKVNDDLREDKK